MRGYGTVLFFVQRQQRQQHLYRLGRMWAAGRRRRQCQAFGGGAVGTQTLADTPDVVRYTKASLDNGKLVSAICAAPSVLGRYGMLKGKKATCYPGFEGYLEECEYTGQSITVCGNIITAKGMGCAIAFSGAMIRYFKGEEISRKILGEIMYAGE